MCEADAHDEVDYRFVASGVSELAPSASLEVTADGASWVGDFFGEWEGLSVVVAGLGGGTLVVVASGVGYIVPIHRPEEYEVIWPRPIREVLLAEGTRIAVLVGYTNLAAVDARGERWRSGRLVSDGFTTARIEAGDVVVRGFHAPSHSDVEVSLRMSSGEVTSRR